MYFLDYLIYTYSFSNHIYISYYLGHTNQAQLRKRGQKKEAALKIKYNTYHRHVSKYNSNHDPDEPIPDPTFNQVRAMSITDLFWDGSGLSHPNEAWATNDDVKTGIQAFLTKRSAVEELRRIGREVRQLILWALDHQARVNDCQTDTSEFSPCIICSLIKCC